MMEFKTGDKVVYPSQGVARVQGVVNRKIGGLKDDFYLLEMESHNSTLMIPVGNAQEVGLRHVSNKRQLKELFKILRAIQAEPDPDWKKRHKQNLEDMRTGSLLGVGRVLRDLHILGSRKTLGLRDQKMLDQARQFIASEMAAIQEISEEEALTQIDELLSPAASSS